MRNLQLYTLLFLLVSVRTEMARAQKDSIKSSALPSVHLVSERFYMPELGKYRRIWIYLPQNYQLATANRYPVLYMQDGQNLFDRASSFAGEWGIDESLSALERLGDRACIVVGIDNGGIDRIKEYSPWVNQKYGGGEGKAYAAFIVNTLKPYIDSAYRTEPGEAYTGIGGSSLGANIALYAAATYPRVFGKVLLFSPAYWFNDSLFNYVKESYMGLGGQQMVYQLCGSMESDEMVPDMLKMDSIFWRKGVNNVNAIKVIQPDGKHQEWFWNREFTAAYKTLFYDVSPQAQQDRKERYEKNTRLIPNPASDYTEIKCFYMNKIEVLDDKGNMVHSVKDAEFHYKLDVSSWPNGLYYVKITSGNVEFVKMLNVLHK